MAGDATWLHDTSVYDNDLFGDNNPSSTGFSLGALGFYNMEIGTLNLNVFGGISFIHFGDFKSNEAVIDESGNSVHLRVGAEVYFRLLKSNVPFLP